MYSNSLYSNMFESRMSYYLPDFLQTDVTLDNYFDIFSNSYSYYDRNNEEYILVKNQILKNEYRIDINSYPTNFVYYNFMYENLKGTKKTVERNVINDLKRYIYTKKYNGFIISLIFRIDNSNYTKGISMLVSRDYDIYMKIGYITLEDFKIILEKINFDEFELDDVYTHEILDLFNFVNQNEEQYLKSDKQFFNYTPIAKLNDIDIYWKFNYKNIVLYLDNNDFFFAKGIDEYVPETLKEYCLLCHEGQKQIKREDIQLDIKFETSEYREVRYAYTNLIQFNYQDEWITIPTSLPHQYDKEYEQIHDELEKRKRLYDKLMGDNDDKKN